MNFAVFQKNRIVELFPKSIGNGKHAEVRAKCKADSETERHIVIIVVGGVLVP